MNTPVPWSHQEADNRKLSLPPPISETSDASFFVVEESSSEISGLSRFIGDPLLLQPPHPFPKNNKKPEKFLSPPPLPSQEFQMNPELLDPPWDGKLLDTTCEEECVDVEIHRMGVTSDSAPGITYITYPKFVYNGAIFIWQAGAFEDGHKFLSCLRKFCLNRYSNEPACLDVLRSPARIILNVYQGYYRSDSSKNYCKQKFLAYFVMRFRYNLAAFDKAKKRRVKFDPQVGLIQACLDSRETETFVAQILHVGTNWDFTAEFVVRRLHDGVAEHLKTVAADYVDRSSILVNIINASHRLYDTLVSAYRKQAGAPEVVYAINAFYRSLDFTNRWANRFKQTLITLFPAFNLEDKIARVKAIFSFLLEECSGRVRAAFDFFFGQNAEVVAVHDDDVFAVHEAELVDAPQTFWDDLSAWFYPQGPLQGLLNITESDLGSMASRLTALVASFCALLTVEGAAPEFSMAGLKKFAVCATPVVSAAIYSGKFTSYIADLDKVLGLMWQCADSIFKGDFGRFIGVNSYSQIFSLYSFVATNYGGSAPNQYTLSYEDRDEYNCPVTLRLPACIISSSDPHWAAMINELEGRTGGGIYSTQPLGWSDGLRCVADHLNSKLNYIVTKSSAEPKLKQKLTEITGHLQNLTRATSFAPNPVKAAGHAFIFNGPSGVGKSTFLGQSFKEHIMKIIMDLAYKVGYDDIGDYNPSKPVDKRFISTARSSNFQMCKSGGFQFLFQHSEDFDPVHNGSGVPKPDNLHERIMTCADTVSPNRDAAALETKRGDGVKGDNYDRTIAIFTSDNRSDAGLQDLAVNFLAAARRSMFISFDIDPRFADANGMLNLADPTVISAKNASDTAQLYNRITVHNWERLDGAAGEVAHGEQFVRRIANWTFKSRRTFGTGADRQTYEPGHILALNRITVNSFYCFIYDFVTDKYTRSFAAWRKSVIMSKLNSHCGICRCNNGISMSQCCKCAGTIEFDDRTGNLSVICPLARNHNRRRGLVNNDGAVVRDINPDVYAVFNERSVMEGIKEIDSRVLNLFGVMIQSSTLRPVTQAIFSSLDINGLIRAHVDGSYWSFAEDSGPFIEHGSFDYLLRNSSGTVHQSPEALERWWQEQFTPGMTLAHAYFLLFRYLIWTPSVHSRAREEENQEVLGNMENRTVNMLYRADYAARPDANGSSLIVRIGNGNHDRSEPEVNAPQAAYMSMLKLYIVFAMLEWPNRDTPMREGAPASGEDILASFFNREAQSASLDWILEVWGMPFDMFHAFATSKEAYLFDFISAMTWGADYDVAFADHAALVPGPATVFSWDTFGQSVLSLFAPGNAALLRFGDFPVGDGAVGFEPQGDIEPNLDLLMEGWLEQDENPAGDSSDDSEEHKDPDEDPAGFETASTSGGEFDQSSSSGDGSSTHSGGSDYSYDESDDTGSQGSEHPEQPRPELSGRYVFINNGCCSGIAMIRDNGHTRVLHDHNCRLCRSIGAQQVSFNVDALTSQGDEVSDYAMMLAVDDGILPRHWEARTRTFVPRGVRLEGVRVPVCPDGVDQDVWLNHTRQLRPMYCIQSVNLWRNRFHDFLVELRVQARASRFARIDPVVKKTVLAGMVAVVGTGAMYKLCSTVLENGKKPKAEFVPQGVASSIPSGHNHWEPNGLRTLNSPAFVHNYIDTTRGSHGRTVKNLSGQMINGTNSDQISRIAKLEWPQSGNMVGRIYALLPDSTTLVMPAHAFTGVDLNEWFQMTLSVKVPKTGAWVSHSIVVNKDTVAFSEGGDMCRVMHGLSTIRLSDLDCFYSNLHDEPMNVDGTIFYPGGADKDWEVSNTTLFTNEHADLSLYGENATLFPAHSGIINHLKNKPMKGCFARLIEEDDYARQKGECGLPCIFSKKANFPTLGFYIGIVTPQAMDGSIRKYEVYVPITELFMRITTQKLFSLRTYSSSPTSASRLGAFRGAEFEAQMNVVIQGMGERGLKARLEESKKRSAGNIRYSGSEVDYNSFMAGQEDGPNVAANTEAYHYSNSKSGVHLSIMPSTNEKIKGVYPAHEGVRAMYPIMGSDNDVYFHPDLLWLGTTAFMGEEPHPTFGNELIFAMVGPGELTEDGSKSSMALGREIAKSSVHGHIPLPLIKDSSRRLLDHYTGLVSGLFAQADFNHRHMQKLLRSTIEEQFVGVFDDDGSTIIQKMNPNSSWGSNNKPATGSTKRNVYEVTEEKELVILPGAEAAWEAFTATIYCITCGILPLHQYMTCFTKRECYPVTGSADQFSYGNHDNPESFYSSLLGPEKAKKLRALDPSEDQKVRDIFGSVPGLNIKDKGRAVSNLPGSINVAFRMLLLPVTYLLMNYPIEFDMVAGLDMGSNHFEQSTNQMFHEGYDPESGMHLVFDADVSAWDKIMPASLTRHTLMIFIELVYEIHKYYGTFTDRLVIFAETLMKWWDDMTLFYSGVLFRLSFMPSGFVMTLPLNSAMNQLLAICNVLEFARTRFLKPPKDFTTWIRHKALGDDSQSAVKAALVKACKEAGIPVYSAVEYSEINASFGITSTLGDKSESSDLRFQDPSKLVFLQHVMFYLEIPAFTLEEVDEDPLRLTHTVLVGAAPLKAPVLVKLLAKQDSSSTVDPEYLLRDQVATVLFELVPYGRERFDRFVRALQSFRHPVWKTSEMEHVYAPLFSWNYWLDRYVKKFCKNGCLDPAILKQREDNEESFEVLKNKLNPDGIACLEYDPLM